MKKTEASIVIEKIIRFNITLEDLASKMKAKYVTVWRWSKGEREPNRWALEKLNQILRRYELRNR